MQMTAHRTNRLIKPCGLAGPRLEEIVAMGDGAAETEVALALARHVVEYAEGRACMRACAMADRCEAET